LISNPFLELLGLHGYGAFISSGVYDHLGRCALSASQSTSNLDAVAEILRIDDVQEDIELAYSHVGRHFHTEFRNDWHVDLEAIIYS
jgi:hypothetical protein